MSQTLEIVFVPLAAPLAQTAVLLSGKGGALSAAGAKIDAATGGSIGRAIEAADHKGRAKSSIEILAPTGVEARRLIVSGCEAEGDTDPDFLQIGGYVFAQIQARKPQSATLLADVTGTSGKAAAEMAADIACGALLRSYEFSKYLTKKGDDDSGETARNGVGRLEIACAEPEAAAQAFQRRSALADGVFMARDLVNEPANVLGPVEFADRVRALTNVGVEVEILDVEALEALGMRALLAVAQGSVRPARVAVLQWHGAKSKRAKPLCFIGKGVVFDTGGISIKPAAGMEDMKGDMGGAACVAGLMHALAARRAGVNAVGLLGLVENMPSGTAQRPGDIVKSMAGLTIEVLNTDAEGRLVLADLLHYAQERFKPKLMVNLATLTGAIMVALGKEYAGMFANDDRLAEDLYAAGEATGEKVWRMPLAKAYDKLIDSRNADVKNIGGRYGGAITAAQFLQRFVDKDTPWAHLDIAGVAMDSNKSEISQSWASGWGVRLLDRFVSDHHERAEKS